MTEAFYRKLPWFAITSSQDISKIGHLSAQMLDRRSFPNDIVRYGIHLPIVKDDNDLWECEIKVNQALSELKRHGGGPVHINLTTTYGCDYSVKTLHWYVLSGVFILTMFFLIYPGKNWCFCRIA